MIKSRAPSPESSSAATPGAPALAVCAIIPTYNHAKVLPNTVRFLQEQSIPVVIVDDGNRPDIANVISALASNDVAIIRHDINQGKGAAVRTGLTWARRQGYTHALQIDADGQHDLASVQKLLDCARAHPDALVSGRPVYDASVPRARLIGRYATHVWVWVETLSFQIADSMCGFRVYPVAASLAVFDQEPVGTRMDFDTDIMVRLFWRGTPTRHISVPVIYPPDNTSNFRLLSDNWRITRMHTRLVFTMLRRLPSILRNRPRG